MSTVATAPARSASEVGASNREALRARLQRAPLMGATLAFAAGILLAARVWRPTVWWIAATVFMLGAAVFFYQRKLRLARLLCLAALVFLGAVSLQLHQIAAPHIENDSRFTRISDGREVMIEGYAMRD